MKDILSDIRDKLSDAGFKSEEHVRLSFRNEKERNFRTIIWNKK